MSEDRIDLSKLVREGAHPLRNGAESKLADNGDEKTIEDCPNDWSIAPRTSRIFLKANVSDPMQSIFNRPMLLNVLEELSGTGFKVRDVTDILLK